MYSGIGGGNVRTSIDEVRACRRMFNDPDVVICRNRIMQTLKIDQIVFMDGQRKLTLLPQFARVFSVYWSKFIDDFMECMFTLGEVPVALVEIDDPLIPDLVIPVVPPLEDFVIGVRIEGYRAVHKFYSLSHVSKQYLDYEREQNSAHREHRTKVNPVTMKKSSLFDAATPVIATELLHQPDSALATVSRMAPAILSSLPGMAEDPDVHIHQSLMCVDDKANLRSHMKILLHHKNYVDLIKRCALNAELLNCNPAIYLENRSDKIKNDNENLSRVTVEMANGTSMLDNLNRAHDTGLIDRLREYTNARLNAPMTSMSSAAVTADDVSTGGIDIESLALPRPTTQKIPLPSGAAITQQAKATSRSDLVELMHHCSNTVYDVMGVPRSVFTSENSNVRGNSRGMNQTLDATISHWRSMLGRELTIVYNRIYGESDMQYKMKNVISTLQDDLLTQNVEHARGVIQDNFTEGGLHRHIELVFQAEPVADPEAVANLFKRGIISFENYAGLALKSLGIQETVKSSAMKNPLGEEEMHRMMLSSYGIVPQEENRAVDAEVYQMDRRGVDNDVPKNRYEKYASFDTEEQQSSSSEEWEEDRRDRRHPYDRKRRDEENDDRYRSKREYRQYSSNREKRPERRHWTERRPSPQQSRYDRYGKNR